MISTVTCWSFPISSTSSVLLISGEILHYNIYNSLCIAPLDKCTPIYIVRQSICFTLIELFHQIHFETKIPKTPSLSQFWVVPQNAPQLIGQNMGKVSYEQPLSIA